MAGLKRVLAALFALLLLSGAVFAASPPSEDSPTPGVSVELLPSADDSGIVTITPSEAVPSETEPTPDAASPAAPAQTDTPPERKIPPWALWGGAGLLGVAAFTVIFLLLRKRGKGGKMGDNVPGGIRAVNIQGVGDRENQQDSFGITDVTDTRLFAVVADGMGGGANGAEVSSIVTSHMLAGFRSSDDAQNPAELLLKMVMEAQSKTRSFITKKGDAVSGSTLVAAILKNGELYFISVGDSRIYLLRGGTMIQLNREHVFASELDERAARGEITPHAARNDPQRGSLTSYIGIKDRLQTDGNSKPIALAPGDRLLLMTDGVFGTLSEQELTVLAGTPNIYEAGTRIEQAIIAKRKPNQDNFTAVILGVKNP